MSELDIVKVFNKTDKPFEFKFDGVSYCIPVGKEPHYMIRHVAEHAVTKSVYGVDFYTGSRKYSVAIEGKGDITPLPEEENKKDKQYLDMDTIAAVKRIKYETKKIVNPQEITGGDSESSNVISSTPEGV